MSVIRRSYVDGPFGQMHVRTTEGEGSGGKPLVLLHMLPQSGRMFEPLMQRMGHERTLIAIDLPGHGESDAPSSPVEVPDYAASIWQALDALRPAGKSPPCDVFGIHGGAKLAVELTLQRPGNVEQLIVSSLAHIRGAEEARLSERFTPVPLDTEGTRFKARWQTLIEHTWPDLPLEQIAECYGEMQRAGEKYTWANNALLRYNAGFDEKLAQLDHHIDLINPGDTLFALTKATQHLIRHVTYHEKPDWGLMFAISHVEEVAGLLDQIAAKAPVITMAAAL